MPVVDPLEHHGVYLADHAAGGKEAKAGKLVGKQDGRGGFALVAGAHIIDVAIDFRADLHVGRVDRDGHMRDVEFLQPGNVVVQFQAVRGEAEDQIGEFGVDKLQRLQRLLRVGERVARSGDSGHSDVRRDGAGAAEVGGRLLRRQHRAGDSRPAFVDAVVFAAAVFALYVA
ncbi:hypothetical protein SDC9_140917 [bioreactor metagenome]|uniref:Uncharacterized protein n=1 Tax=bioreactor metagenome TaxID=1076179 RepID=A0A645DWU6_9ZZZZ